MALRQRPPRPGRGFPGQSVVAAWPAAVSVLGGWLRHQSRRPGPVGAAAGVAVVVVNRSAKILSEISAEVARATGGEDASAATSAPAKRRVQRRKANPKSTSARRAKPTD